MSTDPDRKVMIPKKSVTGYVILQSAFLSVKDDRNARSSEPAHYHTYKVERNSTTNPVRLRLEAVDGNYIDPVEQYTDFLVRVFYVQPGTADEVIDAEIDAWVTDTLRRITAFRTPIRSLQTIVCGYCPGDVTVKKLGRNKWGCEYHGDYLTDDEIVVKMPYPFMTPR